MINVRLTLMMTLVGIRRYLSFPLVGSLLQNRTESLALTLAAGLQLGLSFAHLPGWDCPIKAVLGIPCPGCGLSTASALLLHGEWHEALQVHAFAPLLVGLVGLAALVSLLPGPVHRQAVLAISAIECRTGVTAWLLVGLFLYWGFRLLQII